MSHKRKGASYCQPKCKFKANKKLESLSSYATSIHGRAVQMWNNSKGRSQNHTISVEWIEEALKVGVCQVTGVPFQWEFGKGRQPFAPSLDQKEPGQGYTFENTQVVVWIYNFAKNIFTHEEVMIMAKALTTETEPLNPNDRRVGND